MPSQSKLIKQGIYLTDNVFDEIIQRVEKGVKASDTLEHFLSKYKEYTNGNGENNPLVINGYKEKMLDIILKETNNHKFSRPSQKELVRVTIENRVGDLIVDVGDDIKTSVRDIIKEGYNNNLSQDEIAENLTHRVSVIKNTRARTIARTEIARTATASDYVINKERGATHFTVDCRETCCDICRQDYNFGNVEYTIDQVEMLPPRHPNCRCVVMFFIKEWAKNDLTNDSNRFYDKFEKTTKLVVDDNNWTIDIIKKNIAEVIDANDDLDKLATNIFDFIQVAKDHPKESLIVTDKDFNVFEIISGDDDTSIGVPDKYIEEVKDDYFGLTGHSHTKSKMPLPNCKDIKVGILDLNVKYNIIYAPGFGLTIIKKKNPKYEPDKEGLKQAYKDANYARKEYVNNNIEREINRYKKENEGNYHISSIQQRQDRKRIRDEVRHDNLKEQVEFYNNELNQYGIELIYITP